MFYNRRKRRLENRFLKKRTSWMNNMFCKWRLFLFKIICAFFVIENNVSCFWLCVGFKSSWWQHNKINRKLNFKTKMKIIRKNKALPWFFSMYFVWGWILLFVGFRFPFVFPYTIFSDTFNFHDNRENVSLQTMDDVHKSHL